MSNTPTSEPNPHRARAPWLSRQRLAIVGGALAVVAVAAVILVPRWVNGDGPLQVSGASVAPSGSVATGTDANITALETKLAKNPSDFDSLLALAGAYLQKVRETGDPSLYGKADLALQKAAKLDPESGDLYVAQASVLLARHDFEGALVLAKKALATDPERARYYGAVADAQIELGQYKEALNNLQEMVNRKPDFAAFSRVAYLRELHGDLEGAILAFEAALDAGSDSPENVAWAYVQSGNLSFALGSYREADKQYALALLRFPGYAGALAAQGRLAAANGDDQDAIRLLRAASERVPLAEYAINLGDVYMKLGKTQEANQQYAVVRAIDRLQSQNGVNTDLELSLFLSDRGLDPAGALTRARLAYAKRPSVHAADALAWALYRNGDTAEAMKYATESLKLGSRESQKLYHAGIIAKANGDNAAAFTYLEEALRLNPNFSILATDDARAALEAVRKG